MPKFRLTSRDWFLLCVIFVLGLSLRAWGITWGLPNQDHLFSYHSNEYSIVTAAWRLNLFSAKMNPHFFDYGSHFIYLNYFSYLVGNLAGLFDLTDPQGSYGEGAAKAYLLGRLLSCGFGVLTIALVFGCAATVLGKGVGFLSALLTALCPVLINEAHFNIVESALGFWSMAALCSYFVVAWSAERKHVVRAGVVTGIAFAVKYSALALLPLAFVALWWGGKEKTGELPRRIGIFVLAVGIAFLINMPYALLDFPNFWKSFIQETVRKPQMGEPMLFGDTGNGLFYLLFVSLPTAIGWPILLFSVFGVGLAMRQILPSLRARTKDAQSVLFGVLSMFLILSIVIVAGAKTRYIRYLVPLAPVLAIFAAHGMMAGVGRWKERGWKKGAALLAIALSILWIAALGMERAHLFTKPDTRDLAARWVRAHVQAGEKVAITTFSFFRTPPMVPPEVKRKRSPNGEEIITIDQAKMPFDMVEVHYELPRLQKEAPDWVVINTALERTQMRGQKDPAAREFLQWIEEHYVKMEFAPAKLWPGISLTPRTPPYDWFYVSPPIAVFAKALRKD